MRQVETNQGHGRVCDFDACVDSRLVMSDEFVRGVDYDITICQRFVTPMTRMDWSHCHKQCPGARRLTSLLVMTQGACTQKKKKKKKKKTHPLQEHHALPR